MCARSWNVGSFQSKYKSYFCGLVSSFCCRIHEQSTIRKVYAITLDHLSLSTSVYSKEISRSRPVEVSIPSVLLLSSNRE